MLDRGGKKSPQHKNSVTKAWLQFQADIEAALFRKPSNNGLYKNLSDMLQNRMDQLEQVKRNNWTRSNVFLVVGLVTHSHCFDLKLDRNEREN